MKLKTRFPTPFVAYIFRLSTKIIFWNKELEFNWGKNSKNIFLEHAIGFGESIVGLVDDDIRRTWTKADGKLGNVTRTRGTGRERETEGARERQKHPRGCTLPVARLIYGYICRRIQTYVRETFGRFEIYPRNLRRVLECEKLDLNFEQTASCLAPRKHSNPLEEADRTFEKNARGKTKIDFARRIDR